MVFCVRDGSGALFLKGFFPFKKKRERTARPEVGRGRTKQTEGHAQINGLKPFAIIKIEGL
jgi:hypothetical protein